MCKCKKIVEAVMTVMILIGAFGVGTYSASVVETAKLSEEKKEKTVIVDCGHGGFDSGKVGVNGALEKEINLQIGEKLRECLKKSGISVLMTREDDNGLYEESEPNKKQQDMKHRVKLINESGADLAVSIHQNSYTEEYVKGPQVFYYESSAAGELLAKKLQEGLNDMLQVERPRKVKGNATYYILCKTQIPTVIAECGFLSNREEAQLLVQEKYQQQIAEAICCGIEDYFNEQGY